MKKILFVCMHNRFRSKSAEAIFNKLNKNRNFKAESAGFKLDSDRLFVAPTLIQEMNRRGYKIKGEPRQLTKELAKKFLTIVVIADDVPNEISAYGKEVVRWNIPDCSSKDMDCIQKVLDKIEKKVIDFIAELK